MSKPDHRIDNELKKEFQLERMILFSDAVFAIVITLMAIEIRLPSEGPLSSETLQRQLMGLIPVFIAYTATFVFIGLTWYEHLKIFSLLRSYDKGLVFRNLLMLFFIGIFPFSVTLISHPGKTISLPVGIYFSVILLCKSSQLNLQHYILFKRPALRNNSDTSEAILRYKRSILTVSLFVVFYILVSLSSYFIDDPAMKSNAWWWFLPFPFIIKFLRKRLDKRYKKPANTE
jgi:uncharacterized membrane protein